MPIVKPCPKSCKFDWVKFHRDLDIALAHFIDEGDALPSKTDMITFAGFSNGKKMLQEKGLYAEEPKDAE